MNRKQRRMKASEPARPRLLSQRLEIALDVEVPRSLLKPLAWQSAMRKLWEQEQSGSEAFVQTVESELQQAADNKWDGEAKREAT